MGQLLQFIFFTIEGSPMLLPSGFAFPYIIETCIWIVLLPELIHDCAQWLVPISCFDWWQPPRRAHWTIAGLVLTSHHISFWSHCWCIFLGRMLIVVLSPAFHLCHMFLQQSRANASSGGVIFVLETGWSTFPPAIPWLLQFWVVWIPQSRWRLCYSILHQEQSHLAKAFDVVWGVPPGLALDVVPIAGSSPLQLQFLCFNHVVSKLLHQWQLIISCKLALEILSY